MTQTINPHQRIAANTIFLYLRMLLTIAIGLYASRVVLLVLGKSDFGIYGVVGGVVLMMGFLNTAMLQASQRFMSYALGEGIRSRINLVFSTSYLTHLSIAFLVVLIAETVGLWFVNHRLNIPADRMSAAFWVYQFAILTCVVSIMSVPYNSCIVAHERMKVFAYISIFEALGKLLIVFMLEWYDTDKLILYAGLVFVVQLLVRIIYAGYCHYHFEESCARLVFDKKLFFEMFRFAGWSILGNLGFTFRDQGSNILLNLFFGTILNASRSIAGNVSAIINTFAGNFILALNPQITKQYASGNIRESALLVYSGSRLSFYLLMLIALPLMIHTDYILELWLKEVPEYTSIFVRFILLAALIYAVSQPLTIAIQATGRIMLFQILICTVLLLELPSSYILLFNGCSPYTIMYPTVISTTIAVFIRLFILKSLIAEYSVREYLFNVLFRCLMVFCFCVGAGWALKVYISYSTFWKFFLILLLTEMLMLIIIACVGVTKSERNLVLNKIERLLKKR